MEYSESYRALKKLFAAFPAGKTLDGTEIREFQFDSSSVSILPGEDKYFCQRHNQMIEPDFLFYTDIGILRDDVHIKDIEVTENRTFHYHMIRPQGEEKSRKVTFLFHGFNEKDWTKYLPWAQAICKGTQTAVVLFPIAFHMQRAPKQWSSKREMYKLSEERKKRFPNIIHSTLSNVAISMRLHAMPQRFIWSGLQTYYDIIRFIESCRQGRHPEIDKDFIFNIFAYSIGGFLAQILKLTNYNRYFDQTKVCLFCSGTTFNRLSPVSKFILDSEANVALYSYLVEHFDKMLERDSLLRHFITEDHAEGKVFHSMLDYKKMREYREGLLQRYESQIFAITLKKDIVIPSFEVVNTLQGAWRNINIRVDEIDFDRNYLHENPFPVEVSYSNQVDEDFRKTFDSVCRFLS